jgi:membrane protein DedA with SNARE-associated domain
MLNAPVPGLFGGIANWALDLMESLGYVGVAAITALESTVVPIPSEVVLPLAGFLAGQGRFSLPAVILAATVGSVVGALVMYALGAWLGERRLRALVDRYGRYVMVGGADVDRADDWFDRHGAAAVLIGRLIPVVRSAISIPAGLRRMSILTFVVYTTIGSAVWNGALIGLGWLLGDRWQQVQPYVSYVEYGVIALVLVVIGRFIWSRRQKRHVAASGPPTKPNVRDHTRT